MRLIVFAAAAGLLAQSPDPQLARAIGAIKAIDNHGHPLRLTAEGEKPDEDYDALTFEDMEPSPSPVRIRPENPEWLAAWKFLWGYSGRDPKEVIKLKQASMKAQGDSYPASVLDKLGIETMLANRVAMGRGLTAPRFRWVSMIDPLIFPLSNATARAENPDYRSFYVGEERLLKRYVTDSGLQALPATLDEYLQRVVTPTLERQKRDNVIALKFEAAYLRGLDFLPTSIEDARPVYARFANQQAAPAAADYKKLQDFLFFYIAREAGRLSLAVHIHTCGGAGGYYKLSGTNPLLLDAAINHPTLRKTNFVLIHAGWPGFERQIGFLLIKPNVYVDTSAVSFVLYPRALAEILRNWLELMPEKVLFGTDVEPFMPEINWEETGWLTTTTVRQALAIALTGMVRDNEITSARAVELARMVLRDNARALYKLP